MIQEKKNSSLKPREENIGDAGRPAGTQDSPGKRRPARTQGSPEKRSRAGTQGSPEKQTAPGIQNSPEQENSPGMRNTPEQEEALRRQERQRRRQTQKARRAKTVRRQKILAVFLAAALLLIVIGGTQLMHRAWAKSTLSEKVLGYRGTLKKYAKQEGVTDHLDTLLAIMMVETEGEGKDVMQSSESKGLESNSLDPEESIEQACIYYAALLEIAEGLELDDENALIQAYNYGPGYLTYVKEHGGKHTQELAEKYAKKQSGGEKVRYLHLYAIKENGGWIYKFGNMFYAALVAQYM